MRVTIPAAWQSILRSSNLEGREIYGIVRIQDPVAGTAGELLASGIDTADPRKLPNGPIEMASGAYTGATGGAKSTGLIEWSAITHREDGSASMSVRLHVIALFGGQFFPSVFLGCDIQFALGTPGLDDECPMFRGAVTAVEGDETSAKLSCTTYEKALNIPVPKRKTQVQCPLKYRGGGSGGCGYVKTTDVDGDVVSTTTVTVLDTSGLQAGDRIIWGANGITKIASVDSATQITVEDIVNYSDGDAIILANCNKTRQNCAQRGQMHRYQGFPGIAQFVDQPAAPVPWSEYTEQTRERPSRPNPWTYIDPGAIPGTIRLIENYIHGLVPDNAASGSGYARTLEEEVVQVVYGRGVVKPRRVEEHLIRLDDGTSGLGFRDWAVGIYAIGEGQLGTLRRVYTSEQLLEQEADPFGLNVGRTELYYRKGYVGNPGEHAADTWAVTTRRNASTVPAVEMASNNIDFRYSTAIAYSNTGLLIIMVPLGQNQDAGNTLASDVLPDIYVELDGREIQAYDAAGNVDGALASHDIGPWILRDILTNTRFGAGLPEDLIEPASWKAAADRASANASVSAGYHSFTMAATMAVALRVFPVSEGISNLLPGQQFVYNTVTYTVDRIDAGRGIVILEEGETIQTTAGDVVDYDRKRFITRLVLDKSTKLKKVLSGVEASFNGRHYYDGYQLAMMSEQGIWGGDPGLWANVTTQKVGTMPGSFKITKAKSSLDAVNVAIIAYTRGASWTWSHGTVFLVDADSGGLSSPKEIKLSVLGVVTPEQALRNGMAQYAKMTPTTGLGTSGDPVSTLNQNAAEGFSLRTGPGGIELHVGMWFATQEVIKLTSTTSAQKVYRGRITGLKINPDLTVDIECSPERHTLRQEGWGPAFDCFGDEVDKQWSDPQAIEDPGITITADRVDRGSAVLHVTLTAADATTGISRARGLGRIDIHMSTSSGFTPNRSAIGINDTRIASASPNQRKITITIPDHLIDDTVYVKCIWVSLRFDDPTTSNEVAINPLREDITGGQYSPGDNMLADGDLDEPWRWSKTGGSPVEVQPSSQGVDPDSDQGFGDPANAVDASPTSEASGDYDNDGGGTLLQSGQLYGWTFDASSLTGYWQAAARVVHTTYGSRAITGQLELWYSTNGGTSWQHWATVKNVLEKDKADEFLSPILTATKDQMWVKVLAVPAGGVGSNGGTAYISDLRFVSGGAAPYSVVAGGLGYLLSDGNDWAELRCPFPGEDPKPGRPVFENVDYAVAQLMAIGDGGAPDAAVEVRIEDPISGSGWELMSIPSASLGTAWQTGGYANRFKPVTRVSGGLEFVVRTKSTVGVYVDKAHVHSGKKIVGFGMRAGHRLMPDSRVYRGTFTVGDWSSGLKRTQ